MRLHLECSNDFKLLISLGATNIIEDVAGVPSHGVTPCDFEESRDSNEDDACLMFHRLNVETYLEVTVFKSKFRSSQTQQNTVTSKHQRSIYILFL